jgi:hypothetical protein
MPVTFVRRIKRAAQQANRPVGPEAGLMGGWRDVHRYL